MPGYVSIQQDVIQVCAEWPRDAYFLWLWSLITAYQNRITGIICCSKPIILIESRLDSDEYDEAAAWLVEHGHWLIHKPYIWVIKRGRNELWGNEGQPITNSVTSARNYLLNKANSIPSAIIEGFFDRYGMVLGPLPEGYIRGSGGGGDGVLTDSDSDSDSEERPKADSVPKGKELPPRPPKAKAKRTRRARGDPSDGKPPAPGQRNASVEWAGNKLHKAKVLSGKLVSEGDGGDQQELGDVGIDIEKWERLLSKGHSTELYREWQKAVDAGEPRGD